MKSKRYKVTVEYRAKITVEVIAASGKDAESAALSETDEALNQQATVYGVDIEEVQP